MPPTLPKPIVSYYNTLATYHQQGAFNEGATRHAFQRLLDDMGRQHNLIVIAEHSMEGTRKKRIQVDGLIRDNLKFTRGIWEAKDTKDDLSTEIAKKIAGGYPLKNTLFEDTKRAVLYQNGVVVFDDTITEPANLQRLLEIFLTYTEPQIDEFHKAVAEFRDRIPELAASLTDIIDEAKRDNRAFRDALQSFLLLCQEALNPATTQDEVEDMLKQHILTERIFRSIFDNPDFVRRNVIAVELERMVAALTSRSFSRDQFLKRLDFFYIAIERAARTITDYSEKQSLLNTLYEQFFQAYSTRAADTHGIVYTPAEIVSWMVNSVQQALSREFGLSLDSPGVHIIDPCVGTGTFIMEILRHISNSNLEQKYTDELHANEILLLPYYIAAQNIEHAYFERTGQYLPFDGLCFADTLNMETLQKSMFSPENTERIAHQNQAPIRVIIGNPPYNVGQKNESDNNKNRRHPRVDARIRETYGAASKAQLQTKLYDMYVKFFRWAIDRLDTRDGVVCFVSNNGFLEGLAFDGFRHHLMRDFTRVYHFNLKGDARTSGEQRRREGGNIFNDEVRAGIGITLLLRSPTHSQRQLFYYEVGDYWKAEQKKDALISFPDYTCVPWHELVPDNRNSWLTKGMSDDFDLLLPMGSRESKEARSSDVASLFKTYSLGVSTNRDKWVYDFNGEVLSDRIAKFVETYNDQVFRWTRRTNPHANVDEFVTYDEQHIKWSRNLKRDLERGQFTEFSAEAIRCSLYRPYTKQFLYFADLLVDERGTNSFFFPTSNPHLDNMAICLTNPGSQKEFMALTTNLMPDLHLVGAASGTLCFPLYTYNEDGTNRRDNITDWALKQFQSHYNDPTITKLDIFHYVYGVLHSPEYRAKYAANLKRDLPRIPFVPAPDFRTYVRAGADLATLHRDYESAPEYPLQRLENRDVPFSWRVEAMKLDSERTALRYNASLTLSGIPPEVFDYKLGNRSALDWVIDQYRVSTDARSGIRTDPNNPDDPQYILRLIRQVVYVSQQTVSIVRSLPPLAALSP